jgi:hypothetical protein
VLNLLHLLGQLVPVRTLFRPELQQLCACLLKLIRSPFFHALEKVTKVSQRLHAVFLLPVLLRKSVDRIIALLDLTIVLLLDFLDRFRQILEFTARNHRV